MKRYFKVKYGYAVSDQVSIPEEEIEKALYAQIKGVPVQFGGAYINGRNIISITPHWHKHTGWYDFYEPTTGEDWKQIERDCPSYEGVVEYYKNRVSFLLQSGKQDQIGKNIPIPEIERVEVKELQSSEGAKKLADVFRVKEEKSSDFNSI